MVNHPNMKKGNRSRAQNPTPAEVRAARKWAKLTQPQAAELIYSTVRSWANYESDPALEGARRMHPGLFELFLLKTGQLRLEDIDKDGNR